MNIGIVTTWFERGAAYVSRLYRDALRKEHRVFIYARAGEAKAIGNPEWDDGSVWWARDTETPFAGTAFSKSDFKKWIDENDIQVVLFNEQHWWPPLRWCREWGVRTVAYIDYYTERTIPLFRHYDALICNTRRHYEAFSWHPGVRYVPWGTDLSAFKPCAGFELRDGALPRFFHSCGVSPGRKGTDIVLKAFYQAKTAAKLTLHSQVDLKKALPECSAILEELTRSGRLEIRCETVPAPGLFHLGDIYLYPTVLEGIGLTIAESIACGLIPVVTDAPPMNEFFDASFGRGIPVARYHAREDGYYWPKSICSIEALSEIIRDLSEKGAELIRMKQSARAYAEARLDWQKNASEVSVLFGDVLRTPSVAPADFSDIEAFENRGVRKLNRILLPIYTLGSLFKRKG